MDDTNQKLLVATLVVGVLSLIASLAIVKEENEQGQKVTRLAGRKLWTTK